MLNYVIEMWMFGDFYLFELTERCKILSFFLILFEGCWYSFIHCDNLYSAPSRNLL